jgi:hypothetical protein
LINIKQLSANTNISEFIRSQKYGIENWKNHTISWCLNKMNEGQIIKQFRYEDFLNNPSQNLSSLMNVAQGPQVHHQLIDPDFLAI